MSTVKQKINLFVKEFVATVKGDDATAQGIKQFRVAESALNTYIANLQGDLISKEDAVEDAKVRLKESRVNYGQNITDRTDYINNLLASQNEITDAEEALEIHKAKIAFLKEQLVSLSTEASL